MTSSSILSIRRHAARTRGLVLGAYLALGTADLAQAAGKSVENATSEELKVAKEKYQAGTSAFESGNFETALALFRDSYETVASPNSHLMVARSLNRLNRTVEAYREYDIVVSEAEEAARSNKKYGPTAQTARNERSETEQKLAFVIPRYDGTVTVAGKPASMGEAVPVDPGKVEVVLESANAPAEKKEVELAAGQRTEVRVSPPEAAPAPAPQCPEQPAPSPPQRAGIDQATLGWVFGGVGAAGLATFGIFGLLNDSKYDDLQSSCTNGACSSGLRDDAETGRQYQTIANVGLGVGVIGLGTAAVLLLTAPTSTKERVADTATRVSVGRHQVNVSGTF